MIKINGSWFENMGSALLHGQSESLDYDKSSNVVPYGSPESKAIIQRVKADEKRHVMLMRKRQRSYYD